MSNDENEPEKKDRLLKKDIVNTAKELLQHLETGDVGKARGLISTLNEVREDSLFYELGKLTRELHESLKQIDVGIADGDIPNAKNRLSYVIQLTEDAANRTMDGIEVTIPLSDNLAKEAKSLLDDWGRFKRRELDLDEFKNLYNEMMKFLESVETNAVIIHDNLQEVLLAQNYQDLTGQAIRKVMETVSDLEKRLVYLIKIASEANKSFSGEDESVTVDEEKSEKPPEKVHNQDEVDDLLSSLGF